MSTINKKIWLCLLVSISSSYTLHVQAADCAAGATENNFITATTTQLTDNNNGTITDPQTGLIWKKCSEGQTWSGAGSNTCDAAANATTFNWQEALQRAQDVNDTVVGESFNQNDWRLPNVKELASIVELRCNSPAINNTVFPQVSFVNAFWSSSPYAPVSSNAWEVSFNDGSDGVNLKNNFDSVRLVRSGQ